jgi:hypothetical protein
MVKSLEKALPIPFRTFFSVAGFLLLSCLGGAVLGRITQPHMLPMATPQTGIWTTVQTFEGNGTKKTGVFGASYHSRLKWECSVVGNNNNTYSLIANVDSLDGSSIDTVAINTICAPSNTSGAAEIQQGGLVYLSVLSEGPWVIEVQELQ